MPRKARSIHSFEQAFVLALQAGYGVTLGREFKYKLPNYGALMNIVARWGVFLRAADNEYSKTLNESFNPKWARMCKWEITKPDGTALVGRMPRVQDAEPGEWTLALVARDANPMAENLFAQGAAQLASMPQPPTAAQLKADESQAMDDIAAAARNDALSTIGVKS